MSLSNVLDTATNNETWKKLYVYDLNAFNSITTNNLTVTGSSNLSNASARYNLMPQPPPRVGIIGGYLIYAVDPNPSFIPFTTTTPQGLFDYIQPNGNFIMTDPYTLHFNNGGSYNLSFEMILLSNSPANITMQLLSSQYPFTVGGVPPVIGTISVLQGITVLPVPYTNGFTANCSANMIVNAGDDLKLAYLTSADCEISLTSNLSINKIS